MKTLQKMKAVMPTSLNRLIKDSAVPLMSQVFFTSELSTKSTLTSKAQDVLFLISITCVCVSLFAWLFYRYIIGKKGETRRRLEFDTKTSISIPKQGVEGQIGED